MDDHTHVHRATHPLILILVAIIIGGSYILGKNIEAWDQQMVTVNVRGEGKVTGVPDIASLNFGVQTGRQKTAEAAMTMLSGKMTKIMDAVMAVGIEEKDIKSQYLSLSPAFDWEDGKRVDRGFEANQSLRVKVRDLAKISDVLDAAVKAGSNQAGGVSFTIDEPEVLQRQAREKAIANAKEKAAVLAEQLGLRLGEFRGYWEEGGGPPVMFERAMMMDSVGIGGAAKIAPPIPAGEQDIRVVMNMTYEVY